MKSLFILFPVLLASFTALVAQDKPTVRIHGNGNISTHETGSAGGGHGDDYFYGYGSSDGTVSKHDQTMELAQNLLQFCTGVTVSFEGAIAPDYHIALNREGVPFMFGTEVGQSQVIVLNGNKTVIFVSKKATVKNAAKGACNAITEDWLAHGRVVHPQQETQTQPQQTVIRPPTAAEPQAPKPATETLKDVAITVQHTANADKYCKPETIATVISDINSYMMSKGFTLGTVSTSKLNLVVVVNRPVSKWIEITVQGRDSSGNLLWSEKIDDGHSTKDFWVGTGMKGTATLQVLERVHAVIDNHMNTLATKAESPAPSKGADFSGFKEELK